MDRGKHVVLYEFFGKKDSVFVVITFPRHEADQDVSAESEFAVAGSGTVRKDHSLIHLVARSDDGFLVQARSLVGTFEFL